MQLTQHPNLLSQILDNLLLISIEPAGKANHYEKNGIHGFRVAKPGQSLYFLLSDLEYQFKKHEAEQDVAGQPLPPQCISLTSSNFSPSEVWFT